SLLIELVFYRPYIHPRLRVNAPTASAAGGPKPPAGSGLSRFGRVVAGALTSARCSVCTPEGSAASGGAFGLRSDAADRRRACPCRDQL
ncbi:MAG: hypothetical protein ACK56I_06680, partial [bacterium]